MLQRSAFSLLLLLAASPARSDTPAAPGLRLHDALPAGFQVDGRLDEWKQPPSLTLGAAQQVEGAAKVASPQDASARLWLALGPEGLAVAGEVQDERVQLSVKPDQVSHDHLELWLALPAPQPPPIAFTNQTGEHVIASSADCENNPAILLGEPAECRAWLKKQEASRKQLPRPFSAQYLLMSKGVVRVGQKGTVGSIHYEPMPGGYRFEALLPASALPRSAQAPLRDVKLLVDLIDGDEPRSKGKGKRETVLSSSPGRPAGDPKTLQAATLATPTRFGDWPDLLERALKANGASASYQPDAKVSSLTVWLNPAVGNQYAPEQPSPETRQVELSQVRTQGTLGDVEVVTVPAQVDRFGAVGTWMVSRRGKTLLDARGGASVLRTTPRPPGLLILQVREEPRSALGIGVCAECTQLSFQLVKMDAQGRFSEPERLEGVVSLGGKVEWSATPDLSRIEAFYDGREGAPPQLAVRYTWSASSGRYQQEKFPRAP